MATRWVDCQVVVWLLSESVYCLLMVMVACVASLLFDGLTFDGLTFDSLTVHVASDP